MTTVKSILTSKFEIILTQTKASYYEVQYRRLTDELYQTSERLADFTTASYMFDIKLLELEGN